MCKIKVWDMASNRTGSHLASVSADGVLSVWALPDAALKMPAKLMAVQKVSSEVSPNGEVRLVILVTGSPGVPVSVMFADSTVRMEVRP
jgi:WD40 repeat protein